MYQQTKTVQAIHFGSFFLTNANTKLQHARKVLSPGGKPTLSVHRGVVGGAFLYVFTYVYPWKYMSILIFTHLLRRNPDSLKTLPMGFYQAALV